MSVPRGGALVSVWGGFEMWLVAKDQASLPPRGGGGILHLSFKLKKKNLWRSIISLGWEC